jgi:hypothetical protein
LRHERSRRTAAEKERQGLFFTYFTYFTYFTSRRKGEAERAAVG